MSAEPQTTPLDNVLIHISLRGGYQHAALFALHEKTEQAEAEKELPAVNLDSDPSFPPIEIYVATFNFRDLAHAYLENVWHCDDVARRVFARESLLSSDPMAKASKATMVINIAKKHPTVESKKQILFFDDTLENVQEAAPVCNAHWVDNPTGFTRKWLRTWLERQGEPICETQENNVDSLAQMFVDWCRKNDIKIIVFDLDQTLLRIHSFYSGVRASSIRDGTHKAKRDFADFELLERVVQLLQHPVVQ